MKKIVVNIYALDITGINVSGKPVKNYSGVHIKVLPIHFLPLINISMLIGERVAQNSNAKSS